jgi:hypothetical protein
VKWRLRRVLALEAAQTRLEQLTRVMRRTIDGEVREVVRWMRKVELITTAGMGCQHLPASMRSGARPMTLQR